MKKLAEAVAEKIVRPADSFYYLPSPKKIPIQKEESGHWTQQFVDNFVPLDWRLYEDKGKLYLIPSNLTQLLALRGQTGYLNSVKLYNRLCNELYSSPLIKSARGMNEELLMSMSPHHEETRGIWLADRTYHTYNDLRYYGLKLEYGNFATIRSDLYICHSNGEKFEDRYTCHFIWSVLELKPDVEIDLSSHCDGTPENPWRLKV